MKYLGIIGAGLVLVVAIFGIVLWANMPTAKLTVHAVRPMGTNVTFRISVGEEVSCPVWEFVVTKQGGVFANGACYMRFKDTHSGAISHPGWFDPYAARFKLGAATGTNVYMPVWPDSKRLWLAVTDWRAAGSPL